MLLGFILGLFAGVTLMCILAVKASEEVEGYNKELIKDIKEDTESFTYDCLTDQDENKDIPKIY